MLNSAQLALGGKRLNLDKTDENFRFELGAKISWSN